jgi:hypothetical protein
MIQLRNSESLFLNCCKEGYMKKFHRIITILTLTLAVFMTACGTSATPATETATPSLPLSSQLPLQTHPIHALLKTGKPRF